MGLESVRRARAESIHYGSFIFDYYPLALPLIFDEEIMEYVNKCCADGIDGNAAIMGLLRIYAERMEQGGEIGAKTRERLDEALRKTGVNCIAATMADGRGPLDDYDSVLRSVSLFKGMCGRVDCLEQVCTPNEIEQAYANGKTGLLFALQDGGCIGEDLKRLDSLYDSGVRIVQLTYNGANAIGCGCAGPPGEGLTDFGRIVVARMNELGIIVDLSHCNYQTTMDGIDASRKPVAITHSACRAVFDSARGKTDRELAALAEKDGYIGIFTLPAFITDNPEPEFDIFIKHLRHAIDIVGKERVGIGSDWGLWSPDVPECLTQAMVDAAYRMGFKKEMNVRAGISLKGMNDYTDWIVITEALVEAGFDDGEIKGLLGVNFLNFLKRAG
ncbi:MAG: membrane dipeptidase [Syntrophorhabdales bacterium]|jgi:membrane dipeptidase